MQSQQKTSSFNLLDCFYVQDKKSVGEFGESVFEQESSWKLTFDLNMYKLFVIAVLYCLNTPML